MTFEAFWEAYPRKVCKQAAEKAYAKAVKAHGAQKIIKGLEQWNKVRRPCEPHFIPHASTWINQGRYLDDFAEMAKPRLGNQDNGLLPDKDLTRRWVGGISYTYVDALGFRQRKRAGMAISPEEAEAMRLWNL